MQCQPATVPSFSVVEGGVNLFGRKTVEASAASMKARWLLTVAGMVKRDVDVADVLRLDGPPIWMSWKKAAKLAGELFEAARQATVGPEGEDEEDDEKPDDEQPDPEPDEGTPALARMLERDLTAAGVL